MQKIFLFKFLLSVLIFIVIAILLNFNLKNYRLNPFNLQSKLNDNEIFITHGLTRKQIGSLKTGILENFQLPYIIAFGNHQIVN